MVWVHLNRSQALGADVKVFISWSGSREQKVANTLKDWIPMVVQSVQPWVSSEDISAGGRWLQSIVQELQECSFGIICLTQSNKERPWICFEAGALSKTIESSKVVPFLIDLKPTELTGPLSQFQGIEASNAEDVFKMIKALSEAGDGSAMTEEMLRKIFNKFWPDLDAAISSIRDSEAGKSAEPARTDRDILEELLILTRGVERRLAQTENSFIAHELTPSGEPLVDAYLRAAQNKSLSELQKIDLASDFMRRTGVAVNNTGTTDTGELYFAVAMFDETDRVRYNRLCRDLSRMADALNVVIVLESEKAIQQFGTISRPPRHGPGQGSRH
jgi:hypothetical protein